MRFSLSWLGYAFAAAYVVFAIPFIHRALHATGGWISLKGLDVAIATIPSSFTFGFLFDALGWKVNYFEPGVPGYLQIAFHVLVTAFVAYAIGFGIEWLVRRLLQST